MHGGRREGAGRKPGSVTQRTRDIQNAIADGELTPLEYLKSVYQDPAQDEAKRLDAAKAAAPYIHPKLATTTLQGPNGSPIETTQRIERVIIDPANPDG